MHVLFNYLISLVIHAPCKPAGEESCNVVTVYAFEKAP